MLNSRKTLLGSVFLLMIVALASAASTRPALAQNSALPGPRSTASVRLPFAVTSAWHAEASGLRPAAALASANWPADPSGDFGWNAGMAGTADIESAFNQARANENSQLGDSLPALTLPAQAQWNGMSDGARAAWLINRERIDRGVMRMQGEEPHVTGVAQNFAQFLFSHDAFSHTADGSDPWTRVDSEPAISACHDNLNVVENLMVFGTTSNSIPLSVERGIFVWLYFDSGSSWGHRHAALYYPYNDNSGPAGKEGFLGIGRVSGGPYKGPFPQSYPLATIIVMDLFDPCPSWNYSISKPLNLYFPLAQK